MESSDFSPFASNTTLKGIYSSFSNQSEIVQIRTISSVMWFLGALLDHKQLFFVGLVITILATGAGVADIIVNRREQLDVIRKMGLSSTILAALSHWLYTGLFNSGPDKMTFFSLEVSNYTLSKFSILGFSLLWLTFRSLNPEDYFQPLSVLQFFLLFTAGVLKAAIIIVMIDSFTTHSPLIVENAYIVGVIYLIEPLFRLLFSSTQKIVSSKTLALSNSKLPFHAARDALISNFILLIITSMFNPQFTRQIEDLVTLMFVLIVIVIQIGRREYRNFIDNPLSRSPLGSSIEMIGQDLRDQSFESKAVAIVQELSSVKLSDSSTLEVEPNSLLIPLRETKRGVEVAIAGRGRSVVDSMGRRSVLELEGVTGALIPKKVFHEIYDRSPQRSLGSLDVEELGLPSFDVLVQSLEQLGVAVTDWSTGLKGELSRFNVPSFGVQETNEMTLVNIPGVLQVVEGKGRGGVPKFSKVKFPFGTVYELKRSSIVKIGGLTVVDTKGFSFVDFPGILTVFDAGKKGTLVKIFGFSIGDRLESSLLDDVRTLMLQTAKKFGYIFDSHLDSILAERTATGIFNMTWDGEFRPVLTSKTGVMTNHPALPSALSPFKFLEGSAEELVSPEHSLPEGTPQEREEESESSDESTPNIVDADYEVIDD